MKRIEKLARAHERKHPDNREIRIAYHRFWSFKAGYKAGVKDAAKIAKCEVPDGMYHVPKVFKALSLYRKIVALVTG